MGQYEFISGNAADFEATLGHELQEFFETIWYWERDMLPEEEAYDRWQYQRGRLDAAVKTGDYATARVALRELYSLVF